MGYINDIARVYSKLDCMKLDQKELISIIKKIFSRGHALHPTESIWFMLLIVFTVVNILVVIWSFILFLRVSEGDVFAVVPQETTSTETLNRTQLETLLTTLGKRSAEFEMLTENVIVVPQDTDTDDEGNEVEE